MTNERVTIIAHDKNNQVADIIAYYSKMSITEVAGLSNVAVF